MTWNIARVAMYLDKFSFDSDAAGITISDINIRWRRPSRMSFGDVRLLEGSARIILNLPAAHQIQAITTHRARTGL